MIKKDLFIVALATFCLTATLFMVLPTRSQYDPWIDMNDDGAIDSTDLGMLGGAWNTFGDPAKNVTVVGHASALLFNVTNILLGGGVPLSTPILLVDGYSKFSINYYASALPGYIEITVSCGYVDNNGFQFTVADDQTLSGTYFVKTYDVTNQYIQIQIANHGVAATLVMFSVYALA